MNETQLATNNIPPTTDTLEDIARFFRSGRDWLRKKHETGLSGPEFCQTQSSLMDTVIRRLFRKAVGGEKPAGFALLATGGYGREELNPFSDVDLLLVHAPGKGKELEERIRAVLHPLWDWGLSVGYAVQTPKESRKTSQKDLDVFLSYLDSRWVAGDKGVFQQWEEEFLKSLSPSFNTEAILQIRQKAELRHTRCGDSVFVLEPEVKDGKGGLRDYHSALWAARLKFQVRSAAEMAEKGLLTEKEWQAYHQALGFLWRVRNQLHWAHGRREDRLSFEDQEAVAAALGYRDQGSPPSTIPSHPNPPPRRGEGWGGGATIEIPEVSVAATETFLKDYFTHALRVYRLSWNMLEKCLNERSSISGRWPEAAVEVVPGFAIYHGKLTVTDPQRFGRDPFQLWKAFEILHQRGLEMDSRLKEILSENLDLLSERFRAAEESTRSFRAYFEAPGHLYRVLETMHETGFLRRFLPEFERVHCHVQYDRYHIYPVDIHSIYAVRELENLEGKGGSAWPLLKELMGEIAAPGVLKLAALIHDLGKADGASHALRGETVAGAIGERLGLSPARLEDLCFLVREHLAFAEVAQRRDLSDENLIFRFAQTAGSSERLKMLYLLCFADLRAVGPSAWTIWKDTLMRELFIKTWHLLERGEGLEKESQERVIRIQREVMELLAGQLKPPRIAEYLVQIPPRHYAVHEAEAIGQQILMAERLSETPVVAEGEEKPEEGCDEVTIVARDEPGLFAKITGVLSANFLNILSAQISTWESGIAVDRFRVQNLIDERLFEARRWGRLQEDLRGALEENAQVGDLVERMSVPLFQNYPGSRQPTRVAVDNSASDFYTIVEIYTHDRPGLLYRISRKIFALGLNIWMARIATKVDQVVDVFYIQDLSGAKIEDEILTERIRKELFEELERC